MLFPSQDAQAMQGTGAVSSLQAFAERLMEEADGLVTSVSIPCSESVLTLLYSDSPVHPGTDLLSEVTANCGIHSYAYRQRRNTLELEQLEYYPGRKIHAAFRLGRTDRLNDLELQTLQAAREIASLTGGTDYETEQMIHDQLCRRIVYHSDSEPWSADDTAIGALIHGMADCDGYADAMYLCGQLAGLDVRYVHGTASPALKALGQVSLQSDNSHMWNMVCIQGHWLMLDVTWDDHDRNTGYLFYNLGMDEADASYCWAKDTHACTLWPVTDNADRTQAARYYRADTMDALYQVMRETAEKKIPRLIVTGSMAQAWLKNAQPYNEILMSVGAESFTASCSASAVEFTDIVYPDSFRVCDRVEEIPEYIEQCRKNQITTFTVCLHPDIRPGLMANDWANMISLLSRTKLESTHFSYTDTGKCIFTDVAFLDYLQDAASLSEARSFLHDALLNQPEQAQLVLRWSFVPDTVMNELASAVYAMGVQSFQWSMNGQRLSLSGIRYYDSFILAERYDEAEAYVRQAQRLGQVSLRIYCSETLYQELMQNHAEAFFGMLRSAGYRNPSVYYDEETFCLIADNSQ